MSSLRAVIKIILWAFVVIGFISSGLLVKIFVRDPVKQRRLFAQNSTWVSQRILWFVNANVQIKNMPPEHHPFLLVGNHLGFLDIVFLASARPCLFITSVEMKNTPLLGTMCEMAGCLFVERRQRAQINKEIEVIREALKQDFNVVLYPEGTSTNGEAVLPFKKSLMTAAAGTGVPILPMVINYTEINGEPMSWKWRDFVFWYGDQPFISAFWRLMSLRQVKGEIEFLEPIICHSEEERRHIAETAFKQISGKFKRIPLGPGEVSDFRLPAALNKYSVSASTSDEV